MSRSFRFQTLRNFVSYSLKQQKATVLSRNITTRLLQPTLSLPTNQLTKSFFTTDSSEDSCNEKDKFASEEDTKRLILENSLKYVGEHGWSRKSLSLGAEDLGLPSVSEGLIDGGGDELVFYFLETSNKQLKEYLIEAAEKQLNEETKIKSFDFIKNAVQFRLSLLIPYIKVWPQALAIIHSPLHFKKSFSLATGMIDDIWYYAGDRSTDLNWYTKRALLAKIYASTQLKMLTDKSEDFCETWSFLDRRFDDVKIMGNMVKKCSSISQTFSEVSFAGFNSLLNIAGIGQTKR